jgi:hypothetical protein
VRTLLSCVLYVLQCACVLCVCCSLKLHVVSRMDCKESCSFRSYTWWHRCVRVDVVWSVCCTFLI